MDADVPYAHHTTDTVDSDFEERLRWVTSHPVALQNPGFRSYIIKWADITEVTEVYFDVDF